MENVAGPKTAPALLEVQNVCKRFGPTLALDNVNLEVQAGEVLALIGENGAGKSTLLKILSGAHLSDSGRVTIEGQPFASLGPHLAREAGVAMIYQELNLAPDLSIEDNILLGHAGSRGLLLRSQQRPRVVEALEMVGMGDIDPRAIAGKQSIAQQQLIEVARALVSDAKIILFDEPTSSLPQRDVQRLFKIIHRLKAQGLGIVYISHFLEEVREVADSYSVLRDGRSVGTGRITEVSDEEIISLMVGREVTELYPRVDREPGEVILRAEHLCGYESPHGVHLELRRGEILGIAGLVGAGRTELLRCLFGLDPLRSGQTSMRNTPLPGSVRARMKRGLSMLSEDRKNEGLAQGLSISDNITLSNLSPYATCGLLNLRRLNVVAEQLRKKVEVKSQSGSQRVSELSGGNQQKVAIARILHEEADVLLMDEPTKGIDVGTKAEIYRMMGELAAAGKSILFVSSYLPELLAISDRIGVMARGSLREIRSTEAWTEDEIMQCAISQDEVTPLPSHES